MALDAPTILLIDDEEEMLDLYSTKLKQSGFHVLTAQDGFDGIDIARREQPDLILLDVLMPGIKGEDVLYQLKDEPSTSSIPVIFLTAAQLTEEEKRNLRESGAEDFMKKELDLELLVEQLQERVNLLPPK